MKSIGVAQEDQRGNALLEVGDLRLVREVPPGDILAEQVGAAAGVDGSLAHDAGVARAVAGDERLAAVAMLGRCRSSGREIVDSWIA